MGDAGDPCQSYRCETPVSESTTYGEAHLASYVRGRTGQKLRVKECVNKFKTSTSLKRGGALFFVKDIISNQKVRFPFAEFGRTRAVDRER